MAGANKVATVIENQTGQGLTMKVANPHCFVRLATVKRGGDYTVRLCVDWAYQEFVLEDQSDAAKKLFVNSDDCCDYERITVKEAEGVLYVETLARKQPFGGCEEVDAVVHHQPYLPTKNMLDFVQSCSIKGLKRTLG